MKKLLIVLISVICLFVAGCSQLTTEYRNEEVGIKFQYPRAYKVARDEVRNGEFVFSAVLREYGPRFISAKHASIGHTYWLHGRNELESDDFRFFQNSWEKEDFVRGALLHGWKAIDGDSISEKMVRLKNGHNAYIADFNGLAYDLDHPLSKEKSLVKMIGKVVTFYADGRGYTFVLSGRKEYDKDDFESVIDSIQVL